MSARPKHAVSPASEKESAAEVWDKAAAGATRRWRRHQHWSRRLIAIGLAFVVAAVAVAVIGGGNGGGGAEEGGAGTLQSELANSLHNPKSGISLNWPDGWRQSKRKEAIIVESPEKSMAIAVSAAAPVAQARQVRKDAIADIRSRYRGVKIGPSYHETVGGLTANGVAIDARNPRGVPLRIVVAVVEGKQRAYLYEVFSARTVPLTTLAAGEQIAGSIGLSK